MDVSARCKDMCDLVGPDGTVYYGYVPEIGLDDTGDYLKFKYCLDCGQIQGSFPVSKTFLE